MDDMTATILVVDDEGDFLLYVRNLLEQAGYRVLQAVDGMEAMVTVQNEKPDLVLTDLVMPHCNGYQLARNLRSSGFKSIPIVSLTGYPFRDDISRGNDKLVDLYLTKPIQSQDLLAAISICLDRVPKS
jgi:CheY-like chemotaxis protein